MKWAIHNLDQLTVVVAELYETELPFILETKPPACQRTQAQNNLYWAWCTQMANHFNVKGYPMGDKDDAHDLMRHKFLGYDVTEKTIGNTIIKEEKLRSTTDLDVHEMAFYMNQVDVWAAEQGCFLITPSTHCYMEWKKQHG